MKTETILNSNEIAAVKDCLKRYTDFNNNGIMSSYKVKQSSLLLIDERDIDIDYKKMIVTHKMILPRLEVIGGVENE